MTKTAIVTGASRGIGRSIAKRLASDGFAVVVNYAGKADEAQNVVDEIRKADGEALAIKADVSNSEEVRQLFDKTIKAFGAVDVLVNNAGIMTLSNIAATDDATFDRQIAVNLKGTFNGLREAANRLRNYGRIINFSSSVVGLRLETYGVYAATKSAVETLTAFLSKELRGRSITVNAIAPGYIETQLARDYWNTFPDPEKVRRQTAELHPPRRLGQPAEVAMTAVFLASDEAPFINGAVIPIDGGRSVLYHD